jgi:hypothetical protein
MCVGLSDGIPSVKVGSAENKPKIKRWARRAGESYLYSRTASDILHNANCYPLSLQALEFERMRLVSLHSSFGYSEMAEAVPLVHSGLTNRAS